MEGLAGFSEIATDLLGDQRLARTLVCLALLMCMALLATARTACAQNVLVTLEQPGAQQSSLFTNPSGFGATSVFQENFNELSAGFQSSSFPFAQNSALGSYDHGQIRRADAFGGAGGTGNYLTVNQSINPASNPTTLTFTAPQRYFGMWWSAGDPNNVLQFYSGSTLVETFRTSDVVNFINGSANKNAFFGNPNSGANKGEPYAFINFYADPSNPNLTFNRIVLSNVGSGTGFESDNHTIATSYVDISGADINPATPIDLGGSRGSTDIKGVEGPGSTLTDSGTAVIGGSGAGALGIIDGGKVSVGDAIIGEEPGSSGSVVVDGSGSQLNDTGTLVVGPQGSGVLDITDGGTVTANGGTVVGPNGEITGNGTITTPTLINNGVVIPTGPNGTPGALTINGNYQQGANGTLGIGIAGPQPSQADQLIVNGSAKLDGTVNAAFAPGTSLAKQYMILQSAGLGGTTFSSLVNTNLSPNFTDSLSYSADDVFLNLTAALGANTAINVNQRNVATAINNFFNSGGTLPTGFGNLFNLTGANLANALTQIDGENATGAERSAFTLTNEFLSLMLDPHLATSGIAPEQQPQQQVPPPGMVYKAPRAVFKAPIPTFEQRWTAWGAGFGGSGTANGNPAVGSNDVTASTFGYAAGMDYRYSPNSVVGFSLAGGGTNWSLAQGLGGGRSDAFLAGIYGITHQGPAYLAGALSFANNWFTTSRTALGVPLNASFQGQSYAARLEGGYRFAVPVAYETIGMTPYAAIQVQDFRTPSYSEADVTASGFGLSHDAINGTDTRSELGGRFDDLTTVNAMPLVLRAKVAWAHDWVSNPALKASFDSLPGSSFTVTGAPIPHDSALASASAQLFLTPHWSVLAKFDGEFASGAQIYAGSGTLRYTW